MIKVAFYKNTKKPINWFISTWTYLLNRNTPTYSHVEVAIYENNGWKFFSSTNRGGSKGCRWIDEADLFTNRDDWDVFYLDGHRRQSDIEETLDSTLKCKYDWFGLLGFALPLNIFNSKKKWYCSEVCYYGITGRWKKRISPRGLYKFLKKNYSLCVSLS